MSKNVCKSSSVCPGVCVCVCLLYTKQDMGKFCKCNGRLLCLCLLPCMMTGHLLIYIMVSIFVTISYTPPPVIVHYVAPGASANSGALASHPLSPFWNLRLEDNALWNHLQHIWDRQHNPILLGNITGVRRKRKKLTVEEECLSDGSPNNCRQYNFDNLPVPIKLFIRSMHHRQYPMVINQPDMCGMETRREQAPMLLMAVKSQVGNFENRQAIRETWGRSGYVSGETVKKGKLVRTVFLLGRQDSGTGPDLKNLLDLENSRYRDILQWDFEDTFFNLTLKDLLFWDWLQQHCPKAVFVFKGDDDVFVRTHALLDYLHFQWEEHNIWRAYANNSEMVINMFVGDVIHNAVPSREPSTKYYIPESFYKGVYPPYAGGGGVVYTGSLASRLKEVSEKIRLFPIDDVYLGMCLFKLGIAPSPHPGFLSFGLPESSRYKPCAYKSVLMVHKRSPKEMLLLWKQLQNLYRC
ncbi:N-acetyllactosaminide beta-1,3-N-acetylglucosaminyltransferase 2 [Genypterus blacodes]|uniref:N-acetyllactosaminide beta-1,3-N-acetylglucosaminyltransferase 2 n=1 Tax=Genypterus blacodes TaxID=154954 RepID=UPI003F7735F5